MKQVLRFTTPLLALAVAVGSSVALHAQQPGYGQQGQGYGQNQGQYPQGQQQGQYPQGQYGQGSGGPQGGWDAPPQEFRDREWSRRAFHDGLDAARADMDGRRPLDARRSGLFRHPPVPKQFRDEYRGAFQRGYEVALRHRGPGGPGGGYFPR